MAWILKIVGVLALLVGAVWFGQGAGWIHGSFMTGRRLYLVLGLLVTLIGLSLVVASLALGRRRSTRR
ncbi:MAG: hypothetical protein ACYCTI_08590 [Acidimicrobiales bacterium]